MSDCLFEQRIDGRWQCIACGFMTRGAYSSAPHKNNCAGRLLSSRNPQERSAGAGAILTKKFKQFNMPACLRCAKIALEMDVRGTDWCRENIEYIVVKIKKNAKSFSWPELFVGSGKAALHGYFSLQQIVREAINEAELAANQPEDKPPDPVAEGGQQ